MKTASMKRPPPSAVRRGSPEAISQAPVSEQHSPSVVSAFGVSGVCRRGRATARAIRMSQGITVALPVVSGAAFAAAEERPQTPERLLNARQPVGVEEAQVPLAAWSEIDARRHGHPGLGQDFEGELVRPLREATGVGEYVERPGGLRPDTEPDAAQAVDHGSATLVEDRPEPAHVRRTLAKRRHARP